MKLDNMDQEQLQDLRELCNRCYRLINDGWYPGKLSGEVAELKDLLYQVRERVFLHISCQSIKKQLEQIGDQSSP